MFKSLFCAIILVFSVAGHAFDLPTDDKGLLKDFPVCAVGGKSVDYRANRKIVWASGVYVALAIQDTHGNNVIYYDPHAFADAPPAFQYWVAVHECNHHQKGHTADGQGFSPMIMMGREFKSDEVATKEIVRLGFTESQLADIYDTIMDTEYLERHSSPMHKHMRMFMPITNENLARAEYFKRCVKRAQRYPR